MPEWACARHCGAGCAVGTRPAHPCAPQSTRSALSSGAGTEGVADGRRNALACAPFSPSTARTPRPRRARPRGRTTRATRGGDVPATTPSAARGPQTCTSTRSSKRRRPAGGARPRVARGPDDDDAARARAAHRVATHACVTSRSSMPPRGRRVRKRAVVGSRPRANSTETAVALALRTRVETCFDAFSAPLRPRRRYRTSTGFMSCARLSARVTRELDVRDGQLLFRAHVAQAPHRQRLPAEALRAAGRARRGPPPRRRKRRRRSYGRDSRLSSHSAWQLNESRATSFATASGALGVKV